MMQRLKKLCFCCIAIGSLCSIPAAAINHKEAYQKVINSIKNIQQSIFNDQEHLQTLQKKVKQADLDIQTLSHQLEKTEHSSHLKNSDMQQLQIAINTHQATIRQQQMALSKQLRLSYMLGQSGHMKVLLNQHNPHQLDRLLNYTQYLHTAHLSAIDQAQQQVGQLNDIKQQARTTQQALEALLMTQNNQKKQLERLQNERVQLIARITEKLQSNHDKLQQLNTNKQQLEQVIADLQQKDTQKNLAFAKARGQLPWPLMGKITTYFNTPSQGHLKHTGIVIAAASGAQVKAIAAGEVVFARWLQGFGLLLIIDHGDGYMSLYARNNSLYHKAGDVVQQGDLIATVGQSGGFNQPGLYFAIRHNKQPLDPVQWCQALA